MIGRNIAIGKIDKKSPRTGILGTVKIKPAIRALTTTPPVTIIFTTNAPVQ